MLIDVSTMARWSKFDIVTVGHFAIDTIRSPKMEQAMTNLGGPPTYVSVAAARLGAKVSVISKVGSDFPKQYRNWLQRNNIDLSGLKQVEGEATTRFSVKYQASWKRKLQLRARAPPIATSDIPGSLGARVVHLSPISDELPTEVVRKLRKSASLLSLDPQGFVRGSTARGNIRHKRWPDPSVLELADVYKSSLGEARLVTGTVNLRQAARRIQDCGVRIVIVTQGMRGSVLLFDEVFHEVPACKPRVLVDPTGAGDAYIGAFLAEYTRNKDPFWCACVGSAMASFVVEKMGPHGFGGSEETYARAREIYEKHS
jgi:sugar/nucleoside kinase (ribokinase family)